MDTAQGFLRSRLSGYSYIAMVGAGNGRRGYLVRMNRMRYNAILYLRRYTDPLAMAPMKTIVYIGSIFAPIGIPLLSRDTQPIEALGNFVMYYPPCWKSLYLRIVEVSVWIITLCRVESVNQTSDISEG